MKTIQIQLTLNQQDAIKPLWEPVVGAELKDKKGAILIQPLEGGRVADCIFVPYEQTNKIIEILQEIK